MSTIVSSSSTRQQLHQAIIIIFLKCRSKSIIAYQNAQSAMILAAAPISSVAWKEGCMRSMEQNISASIAITKKCQQPHLKQHWQQQTLQHQASHLCIQRSIQQQKRFQQQWLWVHLHRHHQKSHLRIQEIQQVKAKRG